MTQAKISTDNIFLEDGFSRCKRSKQLIMHTMGDTMPALLGAALGGMQERFSVMPCLRNSLRLVHAL
jgi:hypothetical protein